MPRVGIALGSNLGDRLANLKSAAGLLREIATPGAPFLEAPIYQTEPLACPPDSPLFYNSVVEIDFQGSPCDLLELTQSIERKLGRTAVPVRNAPRIVDVDLLYFGDEILQSSELELPHPRIAERLFVLQPLAQIRPGLILPGQSRTILELLQSLAVDEAPLVPVDLTAAGSSASQQVGLR